jgi:hypothetical protein
MTPLFRNAQLLARAHPDTFEVPSRERLARVGPGSGVQICAVDLAAGDLLDAGGERFWVLVTERTGDHLLGRIENHLVATDEHGLSYGDYVSFSLDNIYNIYEGTIEECGPG